MIVNTEKVNPRISTLLDEVIETLEKIYEEKIVDIILFGSYALGKEHEESDIDLALILNKKIDKFEEIDRIIDKIYDLELKHDKIISIRPIALERFKKGKDFFYRGILEEGISLYQKKS